jgi:hypothetical protein
MLLLRSNRLEADRADRQDGSTVLDKWVAPCLIVKHLDNPNVEIVILKHRV